MGDVTTFFSTLTFSLLSSLCFFVGALVIPINKRIASMETRLFLGLFTAIVFVLCHFVYLENRDVVHSLSELTLFSVLFLIVTFVSFWMSLFLKYAQRAIDYTLSFSLWYSGIFGLCLAMQLYSYLLLTLVFVFILKCGLFILGKYNLESPVRTLIIYVDEYETIEKVIQVLRTFKAIVLQQHIHKGDQLCLTLEYRLSALSQHVFMKHVFSRSDIGEVNVNEA